MTELDAKDHKILYYLYLDSRQSLNSLCNKIEISKNYLISRIKKLEKLGIILGYTTIINIFKLGFSIYQFNISMQYISPKLEKEIIDYFCDYEYSWRTASTKGNYDIIESVLVKNPNDFYSFFEKTMEKFRYYFKDISLNHLLETYSYRHSIFPKDNTQMKLKKEYEYRTYEKPINIEPIDYNIIQLLSTNARIPTIDIAEKLGISSSSVLNHINKLIKSKIILKYSVNINSNLLGYKTFIVHLKLRDYKKKYEIINYLSHNPFIWEIKKAIGNYDIEIILFSTNVEHFNGMIKKLRSTFSDKISDCNYLYVTKFHRINTLPKQKYY